MRSYNSIRQGNRFAPAFSAVISIGGTHCSVFELPTMKGNIIFGTIVELDKLIVGVAGAGAAGL